MSGKLNTYVLGTANGCPAANIAIAPWFISDLEQQTLLKTVTTNIVLIAVVKLNIILVTKQVTFKCFWSPTYAELKGLL